MDFKHNKPPPIVTFVTFFFIFFLKASLSRFICPFWFWINNYRRINRELVPESLFGFFEWGSDVLGILGHCGVRAGGGAVPDLKQGTWSLIIFTSLKFYVYKMKIELIDAFYTTKIFRGTKNLTQQPGKVGKKGSQKPHINQVTELCWVSWEMLSILKKCVYSTPLPSSQRTMVGKFLPTFCPLFFARDLPKRWVEAKTFLRRSKTTAETEISDDKKLAQISSRILDFSDKWIYL